ncbi:MAG: malto-oligosyltrehalose trehalohydrolase [Thermoleophilia bacterium]|nr:malto-oligosyltrehalose trehalohydrolase [Thermoleophilia bacterium]
MSERLGATPHDDGSCTFAVWAPHAERVQVVVRAADAEHDERRVEPLAAMARGYHVARVSSVGAGARYAYLLDDDELALPDPASASQPEGVHAASAVVDHTAFAWSDAGWRGRPMDEYVIYELHVGTFTPDGTFDAIIPRLGDLAADGITAIELLPVAEFPGARNWGYDGVSLFAPHSAYGGPDGLRRLIDAAHAAGIAIVLDVVYNHFGPEGNYTSKFGPYLTDKHHSPWGQGVNVDDRGSDEVRRFFTENALMWLRDYHVDALRLDAVHAIVDTSASPFLRELAEAVAQLGRQSGRPRLLIAESDLNDRRVIDSREAGGFGHDAQWTDDFHHALHVALTGERDGYYGDYQPGLGDLARSYATGYVYVGQYCLSRDRRHGNDPSGLPGERFVVCAQNHDQVGNRLLGDRLASSLTFGQRKLAAAAVLLAPFVPMLFMGEEYGEPAPFPYFVSHDDADLVTAVREGRAREFAGFVRDGEEPPDPQAEATFESARLDWSLRARGEHAYQLAFTRELLRLRRDLPSLRVLDPAAMTVGVDSDLQLLQLARAQSGEETVVVLNFGLEPVAAHAVLGDDPAWQRIIDASDERFGGSGVDPEMIQSTSVAVFRRGGEHQ